MLSATQRSWLEDTTAQAQGHLDGALSYLAARGISEAAARAARLGVVGASVRTVGSQRYGGRLAIPYLTPAGVVNIKFRAMDNSDPKYLCLPNSRPLLYGALSFFSRGPIIAITEGELDAAVLTHQVGIPAVGCPGVSTWQEHHPRCFTGYEQVLVYADGDGPGHDLAKRITRDVNQAQAVFMPDGQDVTDVFLAEGAVGLRRRAGLDA